MTEEEQSSRTDNPLDAFIFDERILNERERALLISLLYHTRASSNGSSPEIEATVRERIINAIGGVVAERISSTIGKNIVQQLLHTQFGSFMDSPASTSEPWWYQRDPFPSDPQPPTPTPPSPTKEPQTTPEPNSQPFTKSSQSLVGTEKEAINQEARYVLLEDFLGQQEIAALIEYAVEHEQLFEASRVITSGKGRNTIDFEHRRSRVLFKLEKHHTVIADRVQSCLPGVLQQLQYPSFPISQIEAQITASNEGDCFKMHRDSSHAITSAREITFIYYFHREPKAFTGGELRIYDTQFHDGYHIITDTYKTIIPQQNQVVFFPSALLHEVMPIHCPSRIFADSRFTVNGWVHA